MNPIWSVVFQGDSITDAGRAPGQPCNGGLGGGYANLAAAALLGRRPERDLKIYNTGISGNRVVDLYARWKIDTLNLAPDLVSIMIGVNDSWHEAEFANGVEIPRYERIYRELLQWTRTRYPEAGLVLIDPFTVAIGAGLNRVLADDVAARRPVVAELAREFGAKHLRTQELFDAALRRAPAEYWTGDGVHPTLAGHQLIADAWLELTAPWFA